MKLTKSIIISTISLVLLTQCGIFKTSKNSNTADNVITIPQDRETIHNADTTINYTENDLTKGILRGGWVIETVLGKAVKGQTAPFIKFNPTDGMIYGNNGCNTLNGKFNYSKNDSTLTFGNLATTMRSCLVDGLTDHDINVALNKTRFYSVAINDSRIILNLLNEDKSVVMTLSHQNFEFLNGTWLVKEIGGAKQNNPDVKLVFDIDEMKVHGNTGCNIINGELEADMETNNAISFQSLVTTMMACPDDRETELLAALEEAMFACPIDKNNVHFIDGAERVVMKLERTSDK